MCPPTWPAPRKILVSVRHGDAAEEVALDWVLVKGVPGDDLEGMMPTTISEKHFLPLAERITITRNRIEALLAGAGEHSRMARRMQIDNARLLLRDLTSEAAHDA